jgi:hypothetical protein
MHKFVIPLILLAVTSIFMVTPQVSYGFTTQAECQNALGYPTNQTCTKAEICSVELGKTCACWEIGECSFAEDPLQVMLTPFDYIFAGLSIVIFWGLIVSILWLRTQNPMLIGVMGVAMTAVYMTEAPEAPSNEFDGARIIGGTLFAVSIGIAIYHLINSKLHAPPQ